MEINNTFSLTRVALLFKQSAAHHYRLALTTLVAFSGALFIILLIIQFAKDMRPNDSEVFFTLFFAVFAVTTIISAGTAFPSFRTREKMQNYLLIPASAFEKFLAEFCWRIVLIVVVVPLVYWAVFNLEGFIVHVFFPVSPFDDQGFAGFPWFSMATDTATVRMRVFVPLMALLALVIPFTGAVMFSRYPLIKSLFAVAVIVFFNIFLIYFFLEILDFGEYYPTSPILFIRHMEDGLLVGIVASIIFIVGFLVAAYHKIREREV